jgi:GNAT superfamily N-acetyltransferase
VAGSARIGDIAGIYGVGTRQSHRGRGAAAAAVTAAIEHGMDAGARWFGLFSPAVAEPFFTGLGFVAVDHAGVWVLEPT